MGVGACRVAVVGAGAMAREHIRAFSDVPGVALAGIYSRTRSRAEELAGEFGVPQVCESMANLYENTQANLVVMAVPELAANSVAKECFEFPWTVFMEKPPGYNLSDAQDIRAAAEAQQRQALAGLNRRFLSSTRAAWDDLADCEGPRFIHVQDQQDMAAAAALGHPEAVVKNWMYANSIHLADYLRLFGRGAVTSVEPLVRWDPDCPGMVVAGVRFASGDLGLYEGVWNGPGPWAVTITTPGRRWEMRPLEHAAYQIAGERRLQPVEQCAWDREFKPGFRLQAEMAVSAALGRPSESPTLAEAMQTMKLIQEIFGQ